MDEKITISNMVSRIKGSVSLELAKKLMDQVEAYARSKGMACVIAVDDAHGNPVAVHVMENAFLVSYQVATQKAYTAVAVKMSTMELSRLVQPGGTFYGLEAMHDGTIVGGLGISGGTGEEDNDVAVYGLKVFAELTGQS